jgi:hypothetical protein
MTDIALALACVAMAYIRRSPGDEVEVSSREVTGPKYVGPKAKAEVMYHWEIFLTSLPIMETMKQYRS